MNGTFLAGAFEDGRRDAPSSEGKLSVSLLHGLRVWQAKPGVAKELRAVSSSRSPRNTDTRSTPIPDSALSS
jgi:hypothetical protein